MALPGVLVALRFQEPQGHVLQIPQLVRPPGRPAHVEDVGPLRTIDERLHDRLLPMEDLALLFPQGQIFHRKKAIMQSFVDGTERPYVFHMCWTAGRTDKLRYLKNMALWFLEPKCDQDSWKGHRDHGNSTFDHNQANCCLAGAKPWLPPQLSFRTGFPKTTQ